MSVSKELSDTPGEMDPETNFEAYEGFMAGAKYLSISLVIILVGMAVFLV